MRQAYIYLTLDTNRTSQEEQVFNRVHLEQEEDWRLDGAAIAM